MTSAYPFGAIYRHRQDGSVIMLLGIGPLDTRTALLVLRRDHGISLLGLGSGSTGRIKVSVLKDQWARVE